ncbi:MAG TPA: AEC family transporter [Clostridia bacterium]|nr:AEC family transporter [Clostridia bacterium]
MEQLSASIVAMFGILILSYGAKQARLMPADTNGVLSSLLYNVTSPCLIFTSLAAGPGMEVLRQALVMAGVAFVYCGLACLVAFFFLRKTPPGDKTGGVVVFSSIFGNTGFMGIPLSYMVFGNTGVVMSALYDQVHNLYMYTVGVSLLGVKGKNFWETLVSRFKEPPLVGFMAGLLVLLSGIEIPGPVLQPVKMLGDATSALAMFTIGQFMVLSGFRQYQRLKKLLLVIGLRLVLLPCIVLSMTSLLPLSPQVRGVLVIMAASPAAVMSAILSQRYDKDYEFAVMAVVATTALSVVSMPLIMMLLPM